MDIERKGSLEVRTENRERKCPSSDGVEPQLIATTTFVAFEMDRGTEFFGRVGRR
jgi:hypothetical protein